MRTKCITEEKYAQAALQLARETKATGTVYPLRFQSIMRQNKGFVSALTPYGKTPDGLERKNPVIVALGDSVTAGHFELVEDLEKVFARIHEGTFGENDAIEIIDERICYLEQFRNKLIEKYEQTSVSTINCGIAGDTIYGMARRLYRDVIRYQPDLVLINGSLNWTQECGTDADYERVLSEIIACIKQETKADIVLLTPNMHLRPQNQPEMPDATLKGRIGIIRELAERERVCLADAFKIWELYEQKGYPVEQLLAGGSGGHPTQAGHEIYAEVLMQLM